MHYIKSTLFILLLFPAAWAQAQYIVQGEVIDNVTKQPITDAEINLLPGNKTVLSNVNGSFLIDDVEEGEYTLTIKVPEHATHEQVVEVNNDLNLGEIPIKWLKGDPQNTVTLDDRSSADNIPTITLTENDFDDDLEGGQDISGLLTASRDLFISRAAFNWSSARFRIRGLGSEFSDVNVNGMPVNDLESNFVYWGLWGGLNDMFRLRQNEVGMGSIDFAFGGIGGANSIDLRASRQRKQFRASYAISNRSYRNRVMVTYNTGLLPSGWAFSVSASRRWAQEGYIPGTPYNNYAYFLGAEKVFNEKHSLGVTVFGSPVRRGKSFPGTKELYDLAGTNYYNSNWGYQNGEKRNARIGHTHEPIGIVRHDWTFNEGDFLTTSIGVQYGTNGSTALNWFDDTPDPRPDYYRNLPSFIENPETSAQVETYFKNNPEALQLDWHSFYNINRNNSFTVNDANGIKGNTVQGNLSRYIVEDRRYDGRQFSFRTLYNNTINSKYTLQVGGQFVAYQSNNYKILEDDLGGDFWFDVDRFLLRNFEIDDPVVYNDLSTPRKIIREGDKFEYNYTGNGRNAEIWSQLQYTGKRFEAFIAGEAGYNTFWRDGVWANGKFPETSKGKSEAPEFLTYGLKAGATYKFNGRNYIYANGAMMSQAPTFRYSFVSPRTRNDLVDGLTTQKIRGIEGGYVLRSPYFKARFTAYLIDFRDQFFNRSFYLDVGAIGNQVVIDSRGQAVDAGFVNYIMTGVDKQHRGIEMAAEVQLFPGFELNGAASLGNYQYTSRPEAQIILDQDATFIDEGTKVYIKNFYEAGVPQTAASLGISYNSPDYWFVNLNLNYYNHIYLDINPDRRRNTAVDGVEKGSELWNEIVYQEKAPSAYTLDFFGGKSFKFGDDYFLYINVGINNILNNRNIITGGFEQFRFDYAEQEGDVPNLGQFPNRYFYMYGLNYFISATFRI
jgi:hypothetical protein